MPTYEYACRQCGEHLEVVQSFKDDPLTECPGCHGQLRKVFSAAGIIFKGSGWHIKDYAGSSSAGSSSSGSDRSASSEASSSDSTASAAASDSGSSTSSSSTSSTAAESA
jgi:putative FmdB family regulatory protein